MGTLYTSVLGREPCINRELGAGSVELVPGIARKVHSGLFRDLVLFWVSAACGRLVQMTGAWLGRGVSYVDLEGLGWCSLIKETLCDIQARTAADLGAMGRRYLGVMTVCGP